MSDGPQRKNLFVIDAFLKSRYNVTDMLAMDAVVLSELSDEEKLKNITELLNSLAAENNGETV